MDNNANKVQIDYTFTSDFSHLSKREKEKPTIALNVEGILDIKINDTSYFKEDIALLEFFLHLDRWIKKVNKANKNEIPEFHYYSLELDDDSPIISLLPFNNSARLSVLWPLVNINNVLNTDSILNEFKLLHEKLGKDIEWHYKIDIHDFMGKVPLRNA